MAECSNVVKELKDITKCMICSSTLQNPVRLKCFHGYCTKCLYNLKKVQIEGKSGWNCHGCGSFTEENEMQVDGFLQKVIFLKENKKKEKKSDSVCEFCEEEKDGLLFCEECRMNICSKCKHYHEKAPALKHHSIVKRNHDTSDLEVINDVFYCSKHDQQVLETYCVTCGEVLCKRCLMNHNKHSIQTCETNLSEKVKVMADNCKNINTKTEKADQMVDSLNKEIVNTRETFAKWRIESDKKFETLLKRLKAMKATVEEQVNDVESRNIERLVELRTYLQNQAEKFRVVSMRAELVKTMTKQQSQLMELQSGLLGLANKLSMEEIHSEYFKVKLPHIEEEVHEYSDDELRQILRPVQYRKVHKYVDHSGIQIGKNQNESMCGDLKQYFNQTFKKSTTIKLQGRCDRVNLIDELLSVAIARKNIIQQFNTSGQCVNQYHNAHQTRVVKQAFNGDIIAAGDEGVYITNFTDWSLLKPGRYCDIVTRSNRFTALGFNPREAVTFEYCYHKIKRLYEWQLKSSINIANNRDFLSHDSTMISSSVDNSLIVCNSNTLLVYSKTGKCVKSMQLPCTYYSILGTDKCGNVLLGEYQQGYIYSVNNIEDLDPSTLQQYLVFQEIVYIEDMAMDCDNNLWVLRSEILTKYSPVKYM